MSILGIESATLRPWLATELGLSGASFARVGTGRSNLTYLITAEDGRTAVLRRPPMGDHPATAHDVLREGRIMAALHEQVPVPEVLAMCTDTEVTGAPFIVMSQLTGQVVASPEVAETIAPERRAAMGPALVDALVQLHRVDPAVLEMPHLLDRRDFVPRQLKRWIGNWERVRTRESADLPRAHELLAARVPEQTRVGIVHGDFRLDNCVFDASGRVEGVLDWELATIGDPLADLGQLLVYWTEPDDAETALFAPPTSVGGFSTRAELAARYEEAFGPAPIDYYLAFNWWKVACILEDVYSRMVRGAMGATDRTPESFGDQAARVARHAVELAEALD
ncbi:phosphotransferase family protein [Enemella sp. A6]|uniref:phosphotransferase family protein n=1 Tax=Enemella sp. A6 TaxID=3440152 RepID=UPI003EC1333E